MLYKGFISTGWFYSLNLAKLYEISNPFFHEVLEKITSDSYVPLNQVKIPYFDKIYKLPTLLQSFNYLIKTFKIVLIRIYSQLIKKDYRWGIAYQFTKSWKDVSLRRSIKIPSPKNRFLADPFLIKRDNDHYCFVEDYNYSKKKGIISVHKINSFGSKEIGIALSEDFHLSYPYLFEYQGELFMCPETSQKKEIRLYKCFDFPLGWKFYKTIMSNVSAVDTGIFL